MARIAGVNLPNQKRLEIGLTYIYGIGRSTAQKICTDTGLSRDEKIKALESCGIRVAKSPAAIGETLAAAVGVNA